MQRDEAIDKLRCIEGQDLVALAVEYDVTVWKGDKLNKGWAGHVIERHLGLDLNSAQSPNFGSWELKVVPLKRLKSGATVPKETMAVTMIDAINLAEKPFRESHLLAKLRKIVICARMFESREEECSRLVKVASFDLDDPGVYQQVEEDYEEARTTVREKGFEALTGRMGVLVQPRTKGTGHGSRTRAFYARKDFVSMMLGLEE